MWAGFLKIFNILEFAKNIANYKVFPLRTSFFLALVVPWIELIREIFLITGIFRRASALLLSGFLAFFLVLITIIILRGLNIECACFGSFNQKVNHKLILFECVLIFFSVELVSGK